MKAAHPAQTPLVGTCTGHPRLSSGCGPRPSRPEGGGKGKRGGGQDSRTGEHGGRSGAETGRRWRQRLQRPPAPALTFSGGGPPGTPRAPRDPRPPLRGEGRGPGPAQGTLRACAGAAAPPGALCAGGLREEGGGGKAEAVPRGGYWWLALPTIKIHNQVSFESTLLHMQNSN